MLFEMSIVDLSSGLGEGLAALLALVGHLVLRGVDVPDPTISLLERRPPWTTHGDHKHEKLQ